MWQWLSQLDPNTLVGAFTVIGTLSTWLWNKARGKKQDSFSDTMTDVLKTFASELLDEYLPTETVANFLKRARIYIEERAWKVLSKRGVPRNSLTEKLLHSAIEKVSSALANEAAKKKMEFDLSKLAQITSETAAEFRK